ncbi:MAG TPA: hypothetical protein PKD24_17220 [Pyrinomonadaceae bacterium]|nr:hypothetical protein [Pyrinomonadaceae bacterium]HMP66364.1 hypothetical protein [Pyrinomonadaceae bacterium]
MNNNRTTIFLFAFSVSTVGCESKSQSDVVLNDPNQPVCETTETPSASFGKYWDFAREGNFDEIEAYIGNPPDRFLLCQSISREECNNKLLASTSHQNDNDKRFELKISPDSSLVRNNVPVGIKNNFWRSYTVIHEETFDEEVRLRISVKGSGFLLDRDVLMFRDCDKWKLFAFVDPGAYESFAQQ